MLFVSGGDLSTATRDNQVTLETLVTSIGAVIFAALILGGCYGAALSTVGGML